MRTYVAIDLKSFYASVECIERGLDPMKTNLVVADISRTQKTICLAVSPALKSFGVSGRPRLFEVVKRVKEVNIERMQKFQVGLFSGKSHQLDELKQHPEWEVDYIVATPRMAYYMEYSTKIYQIYLKYIAPEDIHVYSIDEVMMDITDYLNTYNITAHELVKRIIQDILKTTGITATAGMGTNLYLCKIAMDIMAKKAAADKDGVRIAYLDEKSYREQLWDHRPITDFWRVGKGYAKKLASYGMYTMGDVARCSIGTERAYQNEELLYKLFGVDAELLIDHAWGWEPCTISDVKAYKPQTSSLTAGQVLQHPYTVEKGKLVVKEMIDSLALDLVEKKMVTDQIVLTVGYDIYNLEKGNYRGEVVTDVYGRKIPKHAHGTANLKSYTSSGSVMRESVTALYDQIVDQNLFIRRLNISVNHVIEESEAAEKENYHQLNLFDYQEQVQEKKHVETIKERKLQEAVLNIKNKYGKNAILKGMSLESGATAKERNNQIGGHKA